MSMCMCASGVDFDVGVFNLAVVVVVESVEGWWWVVADRCRLELDGILQGRARRRIWS